ncbi:MAG: hypothetical protein AAF791_01645 [Bacteroidota bacterium]
MPPAEYSEAQAADLLRRAARLQADRDDRRPTGLTLDEVKRAAEAAGIDAAFVDQAALGAHADTPPTPFIAGVQTSARRVRVVPGRVSDAEWGQMVAMLRRDLGGKGTAETIGQTREWRRNPLLFVLEPEGTHTRITATATWAGDVRALFYASLFYVAGALGFGAAWGLNGTEPMAVFAVLFTAMALVHALWLTFRLGPKGPRVEGKFDRALDAIEEIAGKEEREAVLAEAPELPDDPARIDPALLDDLPRLGAGAEAPERRRERS